MSHAATTGSDDDPIPLEWDEALDKHVEMMRADDAAEATIRSHRSRLNQFLDWLTPHPALEEDEDEGPLIETTTELTRRHLQDYKLKRSQEVKKVTLKTQLDTIRVFLRNLESYGALPEGMHQFVQSPTLEGDEGQRSDHLPVDRGNTIRDHLRKYEWASERHVLYELIWSSGMRLGAAHSLDVDDFNFEDNIVRIRHRPEQGTTLKNKGRGERTVSLHPTVSEVVQDFLDRPDRPDEVEDGYGRTPLFCKEDGIGRRHKQYLRDLMYSVTRPCMTEDGCPHDDFEPETCPAAQSKNSAYECPSSKATHAVRSGALTRMLKNDVPPWVVSDRVDCSEDVLEEHYNEMSEDEKAEKRRDYFDEEYDDEN